MKRILLIDDARSLEQVHKHQSNDSYIASIARDYFEGIRLLREEGPWDVLYLDHDLASFIEGKEKTGYDVICWLEENTEYLPLNGIYCVSSNPVGRQRIEQVIKKLYET